MTLSTTKYKTILTLSGAAGGIGAGALITSATENQPNDSMFFIILAVSAGLMSLLAYLYAHNKSKNPNHLTKTNTALESTAFLLAPVTATIAVGSIMLACATGGECGTCLLPDNISASNQNSNNRSNYRSI